MNTATAAPVTGQADRFPAGRCGKTLLRHGSGSIGFGMTPDPAGFAGRIAPAGRKFAAAGRNPLIRTRRPVMVGMREIPDPPPEPGR